VPSFFVNQENNTHVTIGGVKALKDFMPDLVCVGVAGGQVNVVGQKLKIARFDENEIEVTGKIENVETIARTV
jgi:hypothetical protein